MLVVTATPVYPLYCASIRNSIARDQSVYMSSQPTHQPPTKDELLTCSGRSDESRYSSISLSLSSNPFKRPLGEFVRPSRWLPWPFKPLPKTNVNSLILELKAYLMQLFYTGGSRIFQKWGGGANTWVRDKNLLFGKLFAPPPPTWIRQYNI